MTLGDKTKITSAEGDEVFTLMIRNRELTKQFRKLLLLIKDSSKTPKGFKTKNLNI